MIDGGGAQVSSERAVWCGVVWCKGGVKGRILTCLLAKMRRVAPASFSCPSILNSSCRQSSSLRVSALSTTQIRASVWDVEERWGGEMVVEVGSKGLGLKELASAGEC